MTTSMLTPTPYRSGRPPGRDGFAQLLRAEWTKFRTVRAWLIALIGAAVLAALAAIAIGGTANGTQNPGAANPGATGPNGEAVTDQFEFAHQPLAGNGSLTVAVTSLTGRAQTPPAGLPPDLVDAVPPGPQPWTKAGIIIKASLKSGSAYAAVMVTGGHGVRMQYDYTHDIAGQGGAPSKAAPAWLRLTRSGQTITGYDSADGKHWTRIGTATLAGLPSTVQAGMFAASPDVDVSSQGFASNNGIPLGTLGTGTFGQVSRQGNWLTQSWSDSHVGGYGGAAQVKISCGTGCARKVRTSRQAGLQIAGGTYHVTGTGDIAPFVPILDPLGLSFKGTLVGLIAVIALAALFITAEYRRGMIRTTFAASPHRGRVLAAKALVIGTVTFIAGLAGAAVALVVTAHKLSTHGWVKSVFPVWPLLSAHGLQMVLGTAGLFALAAVLAVAAGATLRRSAGAITAVIGVLVVPLILGTLLPMGPAQWLLRLTPAAAFSVQQGTQSYAQVTHVCLPYNGCYPLSPWHGFAVLAIWAALALAGAMYLLRRRDA
jgi:hypothetical protein